jgi:hypothetical protein
LIDDVNEHGTQWARFSDDRKLRFRLARAISGGPMDRLDSDEPSSPRKWDVSSLALRKRVVFVMLNPSTADAFITDRTVAKCVAFAKAWGSDVVEVVNIFPFRSTYPEHLAPWLRGLSGAEWDAVNWENSVEIVSACRGADRVVAAWGKDGVILAQGAIVRVLLRSNDIKLNYLELNKDGSPRHPLYIKGGTEPKEWT